MEQCKKDVELGRYLSLVLRHDPAAAGIQLDEHGWADVQELLAGASSHGKQIDLDTLERMVRENSKQRYCFSEDHRKIRANQGHSLDVDVELSQRKPPDLLYHGTAFRFLESIRSLGITKQSRRHVHLSADAATAQKVGSRHGKPAVLTVDAAAMAADGYPFWLSENGVWLCDEVPWEYVRE